MAVMMMRARAELRLRRRQLAALVMLIALGSALALGSLAAARRTESAYPRFLEAANSRDVLVSPIRTSLTGYSEAVLALPEVVSGAAVAGFNMEPSGGARVEGAFIAGFAAIDARALREIDRPNLLEGRMPRVDAADEILVNRTLSESLGVSAGDALPLILTGQGGTSGEITFRVVGVSVLPSEVIPITRFDAAPAAILTPAAYERWKHIGVAFDGVMLVLREGTDTAAFESKVRALAKSFPDTGGDVFFSDERTNPPLVARALRPQVLAFGAFTVVAAVAALLVIIQMLGRHTLLDADDQPTLRALGLTRRALVSWSVVRVAAVSSLGVALGAIGAWGLSGLSPSGPARVAEPTPGLAFDWVALGGGGLVMVAVITLGALPAALRAARGRPAPAVVGERVERLGNAVAPLPASVATGIRFALGRAPGSSSAPTWSAIAGTVMAVLAVVATFTFGAGLARLVAAPDLYGQRWDASLDIGFGVVPEDLIRETVADPRVSGVAGGVYGRLSIEGHLVPAIGLDVLKGDTYPTLLEGRRPARPEEIVLGSTTLRRIGARVGDPVSVESAGSKREMTVVGRAVFAQLGQGSFTPTGLGVGAAVEAASLAAPDVPKGAYSFALVSAASTVDRGAVIARLRARCTTITISGDDLCELPTSQQPPDIANYARISNTPFVFAAVLALLTAGTLAHALLTSIRRRRRQIGILKTLGFVGAQVRSLVAAQAAALAIVGVLIGVPLGIAAGRAGWTAFATQLGVAPVAITPMAKLGIVVAGVVVISQAVATFPARTAARTPPAGVLRVE